MRFDFSSKEAANLLTSYCAGVRQGITKRVREAHQRLHLQHLSTPSGLHFSSLFLLLTPLLVYLKKKQHWWLLTIPIALCLAPLLFEGFYSIKRIGLLKAAILYCRFNKISLSSFQVFLLVFLGDFLLGTFHDSPLSFIYSFLFLGLIFASLKGPKILMLIHLFLGQILISYFQESALYPLGFFFGFLLTSVFSFLFPLFLLTFIFSPLVETSWSERIMLQFLDGLLFFSQLSHQLEEPIYISTVTICTTFLFLILKKKYILLLLLFNTTSLTNTHPTHHWSPKHYKAIESQLAHNLKVAHKGWSYQNEKELKCLAKYYVKEGWREFCR